MLEEKKNTDANSFFKITSVFIACVYKESMQPKAMNYNEV